MSNTRLIYVSKDKAEISNDAEGTFTNDVDNGIIVKVGDEVSVEAIAINSIGVGAEIIEVPTNIQGYKYKTNAMTLNCATYIHHNGHPFTIMMPLYGMNTINTTTTDATYGYMKNGGTYPPAIPLSTATSKYSPDMNKYVGQRYYCGSYIFGAGQNPAKPLPNPTGSANADDAVPSIGVWEFIRSDLTFEVDTGYDNPANIANKITQDFHAGMVTPQYSVLNSKEATPLPYATENVGDTVLDMGVWSENTCCFTIPAQPPVSGSDYSPYQATIAYQNPFYAYWGSRLLCETPSLGGSGIKNVGWLNANKPVAGTPFSNCIFMLDTLNNAGGNTTITLNTFLTCNLPFTFDNADLLKKFIHSQKQYPANLKATTTDLQDDQYIKSLTSSTINWGRGDDSVVDRGAYTALQSPLQAGGDSSTSSNIIVATYFESSRWGNFIPTDSRAGEFYIDYGYAVSDATGFSYSPVELAKKLDCMIVPVYTGTYGGVKEYCCGVITNDNVINGTVFKECDYGVVDMGFMNANNPSVMVLADLPNKDSPNPPTILGDYMNAIQIGSPNMNMVFDDTRGRFALSNMSWGNQLQNPTTGTTVNASAGTNAITTNYDYGALYSYHSGEKGMGYKWGQSGLGILDLSVLDDNYNQVKIDYYNPDDIKSKFKNSLLARMGFTYRQLTNRNGRSDAVFTQKTYESNRPIKGIKFFPYPLTNNLRFDTSIDEALSNNGSGGLPMFDLGTNRGFIVNIATDSDSCYALGLPKKLENPFWLIKSDIIDGVEFNSEKTGGGRQNVVAVCNRAYLAGDFAFSFATSYAFKATKEFVITGIKTAILNPDLTPADISDATTIIYKVVSPIPFFQQQEEAELAQKQKSVGKK
jgi:hypothetical protein